MVQLRYETRGGHVSLPPSCILRPERNARGLRARISDNFMGGIYRLTDAITEHMCLHSCRCLECCVSQAPLLKAHCPIKLSYSGLVTGLDKHSTETLAFWDSATTFLLIIPRSHHFPFHSNPSIARLVSRCCPDRWSAHRRARRYSVDRRQLRLQ